tara:strand:- start:69 stop:899 length:831 start_codon:yes stop_codon:yes gene_type:complete
MNEELYNLIQSYQDQQNRLNYDGLYEEPADTSINLDPMYNIGSRQFGDMRMGMPQVQATGIMQQALSSNLETDSLGNEIGPNNDELEGMVLNAAFRNKNSDMSIIDETTNDEQNQNYIDPVNKNNQNGIMQLIKSLIPGSMLARMAPQDPRATGIRNFYSPEGLTSTGSVASGIMQGYNPVSGGFLNMITGGKFGKPTQYGLSGAMQRRMENIIGRKAAQTNSSRSKISELRNLQRQEMQDRSDRGESLGSIGKSTFSGPGMAFEKQNSGTGKGPR